MNKESILITGFSPFLTNKINPTEKIVAYFASKGYKTKVFDVDYKKVDAGLKEILANDKDIKFVISLGLASNRKKISVEQYAYNECNTLIPDNSGYIPEAGKIDDKKPASLESNINIDDLVKSVTVQSYRTYVSHDPGRYLCNYIYFKALSALNGNAVFVHFPLCTTDEEYSYAIKVTSIIVEQLLNY
jgi:Pyrrolidone-carboxylate peptidase (N-terminal pyroglutamyl peptidase)